MTTKTIRIAFTVITLVLCLGFSIFVNHSFFESSPIRPGIRTPASQFIYVLRSGTVALEHQLAEDLSRIKVRTLASIGRSADPLENFRFGVLEGKYALKMSGNKITDISYIDNPNTTSSPKIIIDRAKFLKDNGFLLDAHSMPERIAVDIRGKKIVETYRVRNEKTNEESRFSFEIDELDHLFAVHSEKLSGLKIF